MGKSSIFKAAEPDSEKSKLKMEYSWLTVKES